MSISRGEITGFLRGQVAAGRSLEDAKTAFSQWLALQNDATATATEKETILGTLESYKV